MCVCILIIQKILLPLFCVIGFYLALEFYPSFEYRRILNREKFCAERIFMEITTSPIELGKFSISRKIRYPEFRTEKKKISGTSFFMEILISSKKLGNSLISREIRHFRLTRRNSQRSWRKLACSGVTLTIACRLTIPRNHKVRLLFFISQDRNRLTKSRFLQGKKGRLAICND